MIIKTIQWNIGGGRVRAEGSDSFSEQSYSEENIEYIINVLKGYSPDIVFLQETHQNVNQNQPQIIAKKLDLRYCFNDIYAKSHIDENYDLGQAIISKYPINNHQFYFFKNPQFKLEKPNGELWISHDKGVSSCEIKLTNKIVNLKTTHFVPFRKPLR